MRAVNLIPPDMRRGGAGGAGRTGGAVYIILAALMALVVIGIVYGVTTHRIAQRKTDIATATREVQVAEARAAALQPYVDIQTRRAARVSLVTGLITKRFDWSVAMKQIAEVLPRDIVLSALAGTETPQSSTGGGPTGGATSLRPAIPVPALNLSGCAPSQTRVAAALDALRTLPGVTVDALTVSDKGAGSGTGGCRGPGFQAVVFYTNPTAKWAPQAGTTASVAGSSSSGVSR